MAVIPTVSEQKRRGALAANAAQTESAQAQATEILAAVRERLAANLLGPGDLCRRFHVGPSRIGAVCRERMSPDEYARAVSMLYARPRHAKPVPAPAIPPPEPTEMPDDDTDDVTTSLADADYGAGFVAGRADGLATAEAVVVKALEMRAELERLRGFEATANEIGNENIALRLEIYNLQHENARMATEVEGAKAIAQDGIASLAAELDAERQEAARLVQKRDELVADAHALRAKLKAANLDRQNLRAEINRLKVERPAPNGRATDLEAKVQDVLAWSAR